MEGLALIYETRIGRFNNIRIRGRHVQLWLVDAYHLYELDRLLQEDEAQYQFAFKFVRAFPQIQKWSQLIILIRALPYRTWELQAAKKWYGKLHVLLRLNTQFHFFGLWLSTLGGAHSALGDTDRSHAIRAFHLGVQQMRVAQRMGNTYLEYMCLLHLSHGMIQLEQYTAARHAIERCWKVRQASFKYDDKFTQSCQAAWRRLNIALRKRRLKRLEMASG
ncbi:hypothetical protein SARC_00472 [Sphaeroforma arctica JP610]|uniref:Uncharacterized protein n=1 Tax=Sphaeroforma arctica JP610 TaxID=667725 RepID=A0A0L0GEJ3_9EUKA|nr:hypothetical protein SARC_00472 [Sphaeroforma arctica JP610]KNC87435.1 hypothetical protein SARC_00472 [Sphaeroforma arctica JP610]|eukprot:XP_014161337.1 hypothetical protein SARC_00472 [Sphaeroforma arctica JP610]